MKSTISRLMIVLTLFSITLSVSCALSQIHSPPTLRLRTLEISKDLDSFSYQYKKCVKKFLGACTKTAMVKDVYRFDDKSAMQKLRDMNFVLKVRELP